MKIFTSLTTLIILALSGLQAHAAKVDKPVAMATPEILESYTLAIPEISGLAWRKNPASGTRELLLVSDREFKLYIIDWSTRHSNFKLQSVDLSFINPFQEKQSQWESVHSDASGRVYILQETPQRILVLSSDLRTLERTITLKNIAIPRHSNSGGEGMLTKTGGHAWIVNEKEPLAIFEYGPTTEKPLGYGAGSRADSGQQLPAGNFVYTALHRWDFDEQSLQLLEDGSSLAEDNNAAIYVLSDQKRTIALLGDSLDITKSTLDIKRYWLLPKNITQPEGLVFDSENRPVVAIDRKVKKKKKKKKNNKPNLFVLSPLN